MKKDDLEDLVLKLQEAEQKRAVEEKVSRRVKRAIQIRCSAVVSSVLAALGMVGAWANDNSERLAAAIEAFWKGGAS